MDCDPRYDYGTIFEEYGARLHDLFMSAIPDGTNIFQMYLDIDQLEADTQAEIAANLPVTFKGLLVWNAQKYYSTIGAELYTNEDALVASEYVGDVGFYVVPTFGTVTIVPNVEYRQVITVTFDSNSDTDYDPFGHRIMRYIHWFVNEHADMTEVYGNEIVLQDNQRRLFIHLQSISEPIYTESILVRRTVTFILRYCHCNS